MHKRRRTQTLQLFTFYSHLSYNMLKMKMAGEIKSCHKEHFITESEETRNVALLKERWGYRYRLMVDNVTQNKEWRKK